MLVIVEYSRAPPHGMLSTGRIQLLRDPVRIRLVADHLLREGADVVAEDDVRRALAQVRRQLARLLPRGTTLAGSIAWTWPKMVSS